MEGVTIGRRVLLVGAALGSLAFDARAGAAPSAPLFVITRSKNANVVHYEARLRPDGALDPARPLVAYWIMRAEDGRREALTWLEEKLAYGWSVTFDARGELLVRLRAFSGRELRVFRDKTDQFRALARIVGHAAVLDRIHVVSDDRGLTPRVRYVDLFGTARGDGRRVTERLVP
jgi:hypothetical protein